MITKINLKYQCENICNKGYDALRLGEKNYGLNYFNECRSINPHHVRSWAGMALALEVGGDISEAKKIIDYESVVSCQNIHNVMGYASMQDFNCALSEEILSRKDLVPSQNHVATLSGWQTRNLLESPSPAINALCAIVMHKFLTYEKTIKNKFPEYARNRGSLKLRRADAVVVGEVGCQREHIHEYGYLSAVYYVQVPNNCNIYDHYKRGHLVFGKSVPQTKPKFGMSCCPHSGLLVMFPSFYFHKTIPTQSNQWRISIAFDLIGTEVKELEL